MGIQFILSLIGGAVAGGGLLLIMGKFAYKWYKKERITISGEIVAVASILIMTGAISAYKLAESSYHLAGDGVEYAKDSVKSVLHTGQQVIEKTLKWGTVTLLEGIGQPLHDYQKRWKEDSVESMKKIDIELLSNTEKIIGTQKKIHIIINIKNQGTKPLNLNQLFKDEMIILTDKDNNSYSLNKLNHKDSILEVGKTSQQQIEIILPKEIEIEKLSTPVKELLFLN